MSLAKTEVGLVDLVPPVGQLCLVALLILVGHEGPDIMKVGRSALAGVGTWL